MKTKKTTAFWATVWALLVLYVATLAISPASIDVVGPVIVFAIAAAGGIYQVTNVADNAATGKYYRSELDKREG